MQQRIEVDARLPALRIPGTVLNELCAHALQSWPEECCGLVSGVAGEPFRSVHRCRNTMTLQHESDPVAYPRDGRHAFYMAETDLLRSQKEAEARGEDVTAVYHSHVGAGVYLSELDLEYAGHALFPFPDAAQIVLAVGEPPVPKILGQGIFERSGESYRGRPLEAR